uniref:Uncharacterized protein n=1 Tax=Picea glauca TaxID=3330 RepID=A0A101M4V7_PICGL|nr:hypothetical protein ABT39_MTgene773 [Picea glauca]QHR90492.1 hypothetical protein Q903MT_gene4516 [Picea sitchensis]
MLLTQMLLVDLDPGKGKLGQEGMLLVDWIRVKGSLVHMLL